MEITTRGSVDSYHGPDTVTFRPFVEGWQSDPLIAGELAQFINACGFAIVIQGIDFLVLKKERFPDGNWYR